MQKFNMQAQFGQEHSQLQSQLEDYKDMYFQGEQQLKKRTEEFEELEVKYFQVDETLKNLEEEREGMLEKMKMLYGRLEELGESKSLFLETYENERAQSSQVQSRAKELQREVDRMKALE